MLRKTVLVCGVALVALTSLPASTQAQGNPFQIALIGPTIQLVDDDADVRGLRLDVLYGVNQNVYGLDWGLINHTRGSEKAWQGGLVGIVEGSFLGWQDNFVNLSPGEFLGLQTGFVNHAGSGEGFQWGGVNHANNFRGLQLALVNFAEDMYGLQIGLINIIQSKSEFPILPLVNWKMD